MKKLYFYYKYNYLGVALGQPMWAKKVRSLLTFTVLIKFILYNMIFILLVCIIRESVLVNPYRIVIFLI